MRPFEFVRHVRRMQVRFRYVDGVRWIYVPLFPHYKVSETGEVWSLALPRPHGGYRERVLPLRRLNGARHQAYDTVTLWPPEGKPMQIRLHVLLAALFIPNPECWPMVRHLDDNKRNNAVSNLAWGTSADNAQDKVRNGLAAKKLNADDVQCIRTLLDEAPRVGKDNRLAHKEAERISEWYGISDVMLYNIDRVKVWRHV